MYIAHKICYTCSWRDNDAANLRAFSLFLGNVSKANLGLSDGENSEIGVALASSLDTSSESFSYLSKIGSLVRLSGDSNSAIIVMILFYDSSTALPALSYKDTVPIKLKRDLTRQATRKNYFEKEIEL